MAMQPAPTVVIPNDNEEAGDVVYTPASVKEGLRDGTLVLRPKEHSRVNKSAVWQLICEVYTTDGNALNFLGCSLCQSVYAAKTSPSSLRRHINSVHPNELSEEAPGESFSSV